MPLATDQSGQDSPIFGDRFPYPLSGKDLLFEVVSGFANEFNQKASQKLSGVREWRKLDVTSAYPTTQQQCPRITVVRSGWQPSIAGLGADVDMVKINGQEFRVVKGQTIRDSIEVSICTLNERLRDDIFNWLTQYCLDAIEWLLPRLPTVFDFRCTGGMDDQVEYQGSSGQPGFQFYVGQLSFQVGYELLVVHDVDSIESIVNWQSLVDPLGIIQTVQFDAG